MRTPTTVGGCQQQPTVKQLHPVKKSCGWHLTLYVCVGLQQLLAGMRDRGATAAVVECTAAGIAGGSADWLQPNIVVYTDTGDNPAELQLFESKQVGNYGGRGKAQTAGCLLQAAASPSCCALLWYCSAGGKNGPCSGTSSCCESHSISPMRGVHAHCMLFHNQQQLARFRRTAATNICQPLKCCHITCHNIAADTSGHATACRSTWTPRWSC